jgi:SAM-dependent methyltransferase
VTEKYDAVAERFTEREYGDPARYFGRRAGLVADLGPALTPGDAVLDLACADGSAAPALLARSLRYVGVDASAAMIDVAARRISPDSDPGGTEQQRVVFEVGDLATYEPPHPVAATTIFRSLHLVDDRVAFFRRLASFTERKLVFDLSPRRYSLAQVRVELAEAGYRGLVTRPFLVPQHARLPAAAAALLAAAERTPVGRLAVRYRFTLVCAAVLDSGSKAKPTTAPTTRESEIP